MDKVTALGRQTKQEALGEQHCARQLRTVLIPQEAVGQDSVHLEGSSPRFVVATAHISSQTHSLVVYLGHEYEMLPHDTYRSRGLWV